MDNDVAPVLVVAGKVGNFPYFFLTMPVFARRSTIGSFRSCSDLPSSPNELDNENVIFARVLTS